MPPRFQSKLAPQLNGMTTRAHTFVRRTLSRSGRNFQKRMQSRLKGPTGPGSLSRRTGALARSVKTRVSQSGTVMKLSAHAGAGAPYAKVHETGAIIRAKKAKNLAIPLRAAKTRAGVSRLPSPRLDPSLFFFKSRSGKKFLAKRVVRGRGKGRRGVLELHYLLKPSVFIPARLGFGKEWTREVFRLRARIARGFKVLTRGGA